MNERNAIKLALNLVANNKWNGRDNFSRQMRRLKLSLARRAQKNRLTKQ